MLNTFDASYKDYVVGNVNTKPNTRNNDENNVKDIYNRNYK